MIPPRDARYNGRMLTSRWILPLCAIAFLQLAPGCGRGPGVPLQAVESFYQGVRTWKDAIEVTRARGADRTLQGVPLADLVTGYSAARSR